MNDFTSAYLKRISELEEERKSTVFSAPIPLPTYSSSVRLPQRKGEPNTKNEKAPSVSSFKNDLVSKTSVYAPGLYKAAWADWANVKDTLGGGKYNDLSSQLNDQRTIFNKGIPTKIFENVTGKTLPHGFMEGARRGNSGLLELEDSVFKRITYADALAGFLNANGVTAEQLRAGTVDQSLLSSARDYAGQEALKATFNDRNAASDRVVQIARSLGTFGEATLPFKRTPPNILVRGAEYSPLGLAGTVLPVKVGPFEGGLYKLKNGEISGAEFIDNIASGMTGSALMALGGLLAAAGVVTGGAGDDENQEDMDNLVGRQTYALNLPGGGSVTLDWLVPEALPFFMGVQAMESFGEEGLTADTISGAFASISEPMLEMSMLQSLNDLLDNVSYAARNEKLQGIVGSALISYLNQAIPTFLGQVERSMEDTRMTTYTDRNLPLPTDIQYALGKASAKIPGWDYQQIPYTDAWGREEASEPQPLRTFNNFLNPAYVSWENATTPDAEMQRLYDATGDGSVVLSRAEKSITVDGKDINLSAEQYDRYNRKRGQTANQILEAVISMPSYEGMSDSDKVKIFQSVYEYANDVAKMEVSDFKPDGKTADILNSGAPADQYMIYSVTADANRDGNISQGESAGALLPIAGLTDMQKGRIWQSQNASWSEKKNPFTGALPKAGIDPETSIGILQRYSDIDNDWFADLW